MNDLLYGCSIAVYIAGLVVILLGLHEVMHCLAERKRMRDEKRLRGSQQTPPHKKRHLANLPLREYIVRNTGGKILPERVPLISEWIPHELSERFEVLTERPVVIEYVRELVERHYQYMGAHWRGFRVDLENMNRQTVSFELEGLEFTTTMQLETDRKILTITIEVHYTENIR